MILFNLFIRDPIIATIILAWIKDKLFKDDFYDWTSLTMSTPCAFHILDEVRSTDQMI